MLKNYQASPMLLKEEDKNKQTNKRFVNLSYFTEAAQMTTST